MSTNPFGDNPYQSPKDTGGMGSPPPYDSGYAHNKVQGPAIAMIVFGVFGILLCLAGIGLNLIGMGAAAIPDQGQGGQQIQLMAQGTIGIIQAVIGLVISGICIYGGLQMKSLQNHGLSFTAAILAMLPCVSPCCLVGLPIGIWALTVLNDPQVKSAFR